MVPKQKPVTSSSSAANATRRRLPRWLPTLLLLAAVALSAPADLRAGKGNVVSQRPAIVLAVFGTSYPEALPGILDIHQAVVAAYPETPVRLAFTSNIIRRIWHSRRDDPDYRARHPEVPTAIYQVKAPLATIADLVDEGYGQIVVQPTHIAAGEEFHDLGAIVNALNGIRAIKQRNLPFQQIVLGRPALGMPGIEHPYRRDLERAAATLAADVAQAHRDNRALVYMAHGNPTFSLGEFHELEYVMRQLYPEVATYFTMASGFPDMETTVERLLADGVERALLVPFMTVAGDHARNDLAGDDEDSLLSLLSAAGIEGETQLVGLGEKPEFARIFVDNIRDAAAIAGITLK